MSASPRIEAILDRIEDRLRDAPYGFHVVGDPAPGESVELAKIDREWADLWERWDGMELACGEVRVLSLSEMEAATQTAGEHGRLEPGDRVIGERGRWLFVRPGDPHDEGAEVVCIDEQGDRIPDASSVPHWVLGCLGEISVLYDEAGEFRDNLFGDDGELLPRVERQLLRRRLDLDPDAPWPRFRLAWLLAEAGESTAARTELKQVLRRAPTFARAHYELGKVLWGSDQSSAAARAFAAAVEHARTPEYRAHYACWAALSDPSRRDHWRGVIEASTEGFASGQVAVIRELMTQGRWGEAEERLSLVRSVFPHHLELLELVGALRALPPATILQAPEDPPEDPKGSEGLDPPEPGSNSPGSGPSDPQ